MKSRPWIALLAILSASASLCIRTWPVVQLQGSEQSYWWSIVEASCNFAIAVTVASLVWVVIGAAAGQKWDEE